MKRKQGYTVEKIKFLQHVETTSKVKTKTFSNIKYKKTKKGKNSLRTEISDIKF